MGRRGQDTSIQALGAGGVSRLHVGLLLPFSLDYIRAVSF